MTTQSQCNAQDKNNCKYHHPSAGRVLKAAYDKAVKTYKEHVPLPESEGMDWTSYGLINDMEEAESRYYATPDGHKVLMKKLATSEEGSDERQELETRKVWAEYSLKAEEEKHAIDNAAGGSLKVGPDWEPPVMIAGGVDLWPEATGSKYDPTLRGVQLKAAINKDLKAAAKAGHLPKHLTYDVRSRDGRIIVNIKGAALEQMYHIDKDSDLGDQVRYHNMRPEAEIVERRVSSIVNSYNHWQYDEIEGRRNYSHFWDQVRFELPKGVF